MYSWCMLGGREAGCRLARLELLAAQPVAQPGPFFFVGRHGGGGGGGGLASPRPLPGSATVLARCIIVHEQGNFW